MLPDLRRWRALTSTERKHLAQALLGLTWVALGTRWLGFKAMHRRVTLSALVGGSLDTPCAVANARAIQRWVEVAARRGPIAGTCLTRSLTLLMLLKREGIPGDLRIGVRLDAGKLDAHAWVEVNGEPVNETPDVASRYAAYERTVPINSKGFQ